MPPSPGEVALWMDYTHGWKMEKGRVDFTRSRLEPCGSDVCATADKQSPLIRMIKYLKPEGVNQHSILRIYQVEPVHHSLATE